MKFVVTFDWLLRQYEEGYTRAGFVLSVQFNAHHAVVKHDVLTSLWFGGKRIFCF